ncbi:hypothetical protein ACVWY3_004670 [Bradyrhizobium sp. USDA 4486]
MRAKQSHSLTPTRYALNHPTAAGSTCCAPTGGTVRPATSAPTTRQLTSMRPRRVAACTGLPRSTRYPTSSHFSASVCELDYQAWLESLWLYGVAPRDSRFLPRNPHQMPRIASGSDFGIRLPHIPAFKKHQRKDDEFIPLDSVEGYLQFERITESLVDAGYICVGVAHFALPLESLAGGPGIKTG